MLGVAGTTVSPLSLSLRLLSTSISPSPALSPSPSLSSFPHSLPFSLSLPPPPPHSLSLSLFFPSLTLPCSFSKHTNMPPLDLTPLPLSQQQSTLTAPPRPAPTLQNNANQCSFSAPAIISVSIDMFICMNVLYIVQGCIVLLVHRCTT